MRKICLDAQKLADAKLFFEIDINGNINITDESKPIDLFNCDAIKMLCDMFGYRRAEEMITDADQRISMEIFARKISNTVQRNTV
jgi:hypothetical protein